MDNNKRENERKRLEKQRLLQQMEKEIESLEKEIKQQKLRNLKINSVKNLKITARVLQLIAPYVVSASIVTWFFFSNGIIPFHRDKREIYSRVMTEFDNLGNIRYEQQYADFDDQNNVFKFYSQWQLQADGFYTRTIKTYNIEEKTYEELRELFNKENLTLEDFLGKPILTIKETKNNLTDDELNKEPFMQAIIYNVDENDFIIQEESFAEDMYSTIGYFFLLGGVEFVLRFLRSEFSSFNFRKYVERVKDNYQLADTQELTHKLEIRRDNYNRLMR